MSVELLYIFFIPLKGLDSYGVLSGRQLPTNPSSCLTPFLLTPDHQKEKNTPCELVEQTKRSAVVRKPFAFHGGAT